MEAWRAMTRDLVIVPPELDLDAAMVTMQRRHIHHLVVGTRDRIEGMLSERDLLTGPSSSCPRRPAVAETVASAMTPVRATCTPDTPLSEVAHLMRRCCLDALPVVGDGGQVVGLITKTDLVNTLFEPETIPTITFVEADWDDDWEDDWLTDGGAGS